MQKAYNKLNHTQPLLSVIVTTYNSEKTVKRCLEAIRQSTYPSYEVIVIDDGSSDQTLTYAHRYADRVIPKSHIGKAYVRGIGLQSAQGDIVVNVDSDVEIQPDTLSRIASQFSSEPETAAVTGLVSRSNPYNNFASQYKNLYMHYMFRNLPDRVSFLYGSIYAVSRQVIPLYNVNRHDVDDTEFGQQICDKGHHITFMRDLEIIHNRHFTLQSLIYNDFNIPFAWGQLFIKYKGWKLLGKNKTGFLHSSRAQLFSLMLMPLALCSLVLAWWAPLFIVISFVLVGIWGLLNSLFFWFLTKTNGILFGIASLLFTLCDHIVMLSGVLWGITTGLRGNMKETKKPVF